LTEGEGFEEEEEGAEEEVGAGEDVTPETVVTGGRWATWVHVVLRKEEGKEGRGEGRRGK
jgi:hypothetical protein